MELTADGLHVTAHQADVSDFHPSKVLITWECHDPINYGSTQSAAPEVRFEVPYPGKYVVTRRSPLGVHQAHITILPAGQGQPQIDTPTLIDYSNDDEADEPDPPFDPSAHTVDEVVDFLSTLDDEEAIVAVKTAEAAGKDRKGIAEWEAPE